MSLDCTLLFSVLYPQGTRTDNLKERVELSIDVFFILCNTHGTLCTVNCYTVACCAEKWDLDVDFAVIECSM